MKKFFKEFRAFVSRGNVLDMAVGVIIATAFGKITTSLVNDVFMPFIGWLCGGVDLTTRLNLVVAEKVVDGATVQTVIGFGTFLGTVIDFLLVALIVFTILKAFNKAHELAEKRRREAEKAVEAAPAAPVEPSAEEKLLTEIRDLLKNSDVCLKK